MYKYFCSSLTWDTLIAVDLCSCQMVIPGDVVEMTEFQEKTMSNSRYILELSFPNVQISLPNKSFYEKLHNRYSNIKYFYHPIHYQFLVMFVKLVCL